MAESEVNDEKYAAEEVEKVLGVVVKRRKVFPMKCVTLYRQTIHYDLLRLENSTCKDEQNTERQNFKRIVQGAKRLKRYHFPLKDLEEAERKLQKLSKRTVDLNTHITKLLEKS